MSKNQWETFFDAHAPHYMDNVFVKNTVAEVDFIVDELKLHSGSTVLDIGCGVGRHAIELARRGYAVTGVDISAGMLREAQAGAAAAGVYVEWVQADAVTYEPDRAFDAAVCLCEGAFGLVGRDEEPVVRDTAILTNIGAALMPGAGFILTTLNAYAKIRGLTQEHVRSGRFDPVTMVEQYIAELDVPEGTRQVETKERRYFPVELVPMFDAAGLTVRHIWGGTAGNWQRRDINLDEVEIMVVASKR